MDARPATRNNDSFKDLWVFGYGSLMWRPGFEYFERREGLIHGYHRALCMTSVRHRGTAENPGLVMGLAPGGSCRGVAYRVAGAEAAAIRAYLHEREMPTYSYREKTVRVRTAAGIFGALTYVADPYDPNYGGHLSDEEKLSRVRTAEGVSGTNLDYLLNIVAHLDEMGLDHRWLRTMLSRALS